MKTSTFAVFDVSDLSKKLKNTIKDGFNPNLAIIFSSIKHDLRAIHKIMSAYEIDIWGSSSCGELIFNTHQQDIFEESIVISLIEIDQEVFAVNSFDGNQLSSEELGNKIGNYAKGICDEPSILLLASGLDTDGQALVEGIRDSSRPDIPIFGGLAGDDAKFEETWVFTNEGLKNKGAAVIILDREKVNISGIAVSGWAAIGADKTVTDSSGNIVYTINGMPALDVYKNNLNVTDDDLPEIGIEYPLLIKKEGRDIIRAVVGVDREKKALIFAGTVPAGSTVSFSSSPGFEVIDFTKRHIKEFHDDENKSDFMLLFSCMARRKALGPVISDEIAEAFKYWRKPITGFFTYGEIGTNKGSVCDFYNETYSLVNIKMK